MKKSLFIILPLFVLVGLGIGFLAHQNGDIQTASIFRLKDMRTEKSSSVSRVPSVVETTVQDQKNISTQRVNTNLVESIKETPVLNNTNPTQTTNHTRTYRPVHKDTPIKILPVPEDNYPAQIIVRKGDVNKDGRVDANDIDELQDIITSGGPSNSFADIDDDGAIDYYDLYRLTSYVGNQLPFDVRFPVREFNLDSRGNTLSTDVSYLSGTNKPILKELANGSVLKTWYVNYKKKGASRMSCNPPVLNISFNNNSPLSGKSTYRNYTTLNYGKVRFVPQCDLWQNSSGLGDNINVLLRESVIYQIFRSLKIPTNDVVGFANLTYTAPDVPSTTQKYQTMILQRDNEPNDQIPFTTQFNLDFPLREASDMKKGIILGTGGSANGISGFTDISYEMSYSAGGGMFTRKLDPTNTLRYSLLSDFVSLQDHSPFHNEDYGYLHTLLNQTMGNYWVTIPFDMDMSFNSCNVAHTLHTEDKVNQLPVPSLLTSITTPNYKKTYYTVAKEIFGDPESLYKMLLAVDRYPFDGNKNLLKKYLKLKFYNAVDYFGSPAFAAYAHVPYHVFDSQSIVPTTAERSVLLDQYTQALGSSCTQQGGGMPDAPDLTDVSLTIHPSPTLAVGYNGGQESLQANFSVTIIAGANDLKIPVNWSFPVVATDNTDSISAWPTTLAIQPDIALATENFYGVSVYTLPAGQTATFAVLANFSPAQMFAGQYSASITGASLFGYLGHEPAPANQTNFVTVIGEITPYVSSLNYPVYANQNVIIIGQRFSATDNVVHIWQPGHLSVSIPNLPSSGGGTEIDFIPSDYGISPGQYILQVETPNVGNSNVIYPNFN